jgi:uncharacterized protein YcgI (DUF1989 family)
MKSRYGSLFEMSAPADAEERRRKPPVVVYPNGTLPPADMDVLRAARNGMTKIDEIIVPPREGGGFRVPKGHFFRIVSVEGSQVGDLNLWNAEDLTERFFSGKTRALHANSCRHWRSPVERAALSAADGDDHP